MFSAIFIYILESLFITLILVLIFFSVRNFVVKADMKNVPRYIYLLIFIVVFTCRFIYSFTYYGDRGGGSYIRIPLKKPYQVIYDRDWEYPAIYSCKKGRWDIDGEEIIHVTQYETCGDTLVIGITPSEEIEHYFTLNLLTGNISRYEYHEYLGLIGNLGIKDDLNDVDWHYNHHWYWYLYW